MVQKSKNSVGHCDKRNIQVLELNLCDYFLAKRKNAKPACHNCVHFKLDEQSVHKDSVPDSTDIPDASNGPCETE